MALLKTIVALADDFKMMPSAMYNLYLANPRDIHLLAEWKAYKYEEEKKEIEKSKAQTPQHPSSFGMLGRP
jgi:hypothetical protein